MHLQSISRLLLVALGISTLATAQDADLSKLSSLNDGIVANDKKDKKKVVYPKKVPLPEGFEYLNPEEKKEAKRIALALWLHNPGLLAEETLTPDLKIKLDEEIDNLGPIGSTVWQVRVEHLNGTISALIWIHSESKKAHIWEVQRTIKPKVEPVTGGNG